MRSYYFACSYPLVAGSIVRNGNWGRIVRKYNTGGFGNTWILVREEVFERVRQSEFPSKPRRHDSVFLCETRKDLAAFIGMTGRHLDLMYEVELVDESQPLHRACMSYLDFGPNDDLVSLSMKARGYWGGGEVSRPEIVTSSSVRIVADVSG